MTIAPAIKRLLCPDGFKVEEGLAIDGLSSGWIVTEEKTGRWIWTGGFMTIHEAAAKLRATNGKTRPNE